MNIKISIIIPCLNEEKNITRIYKEIKKKFERRDYEIIYVDDGSKDNSRNERKSHGTAQIQIAGDCPGTACC